MRFSKTALAVLAVGAIGIAATNIGTAAAQNSPPNSAMNSDNPAHQFMHSLSHEQRLMLFVEMHQATANMTDDQKQAYRHGQRDKIMAMSESDRQKFVADLQAKWDALPADKKARIEQMADQMREHHEHQDGGAGGGQ